MTNRIADLRLEQFEINQQRDAYSKAMPRRQAGGGKHTKGR